MVAGGMESMTNAPYVIPRARWGARLGDDQIVDAMIHDGLGRRSPASTWASRPTR